MQQGGSLQSFTALFNMEGNAEAKLLRISQNMDTLRTAGLLASREVKGVADRLDEINQKVQKRGTDRSSLGRFITKEEQGAIQRQINQVLALTNTLDDLSRGGKITSGNMQQLANKIEVIGDIAGTNLSPALRGAGDELLEIGENMRLVEQETRGANNAFSFMGDVSLQSAQRMRMISAAAQGAMLSMSILQKNITGVAFSLIFLQFSGALKLSLALAGVSLVAGIAFKELKNILNLRTAARGLANSFFVVTGSIEAQSIAMQKAKEISRSLELEGRSEEKLTKSLVQAQLELRERGIEPTTKALSVFTNLFAIAGAGGASYEESVKSATEGMIEFHDEGSVTLKGVAFGFDELNLRGSRALSILSLNIGSFLGVVPLIGDELEDFTVKIALGLRSAGLESGLAAHKVEKMQVRMSYAFGTAEGDILDLIDEARKIGVEIPKELQIVENILKGEGGFDAGNAYGAHLKRGILDPTSEVGIEVQQLLAGLEHSILDRKEYMANVGKYYMGAFTDEVLAELARLDMLPYVNWKYATTRQYKHYSPENYSDLEEPEEHGGIITGLSGRNGRGGDIILNAKIYIERDPEDEEYATTMKFNQFPGAGGATGVMFQ